VFSASLVRCIDEAADTDERPVAGKTPEKDGGGVRASAGHGLLNDLEAMAYSIPRSSRPRSTFFRLASRNENGNIAVIAAGTGLGEGMLHRIGRR
jgi:hypothetical protein